VTSAAARSSAIAVVGVKRKKYEEEDAFDYPPVPPIDVDGPQWIITEVDGALQWRRLEQPQGPDMWRPYVPEPKETDEKT